MPQVTTTKPRSESTITGTSVAERVAELRKRSATDREGVRDQVWEWFADAGARVRSDRAVAEAELDELFRCGRPATGIDGQTEGMLVSWVWTPFADRLLSGVTNRWLPWQGKRFESRAGRGDNVLTSGARWPAKLVWPLYATRPAADGRIAFDFETYVEKGKLDTGTDVLVIDYERVEQNPRLIIKPIRDELVEVVPGANLGKMLYRFRGSFYNLAFFALRS